MVCKHRDNCAFTLPSSFTNFISLAVPPAPPNLDVLIAGWNNVTLHWTNSAASELLGLSGYILCYREARSLQDQWIETQLPRHSLSYSVDGLDCGTLYEFSLAAYNMVGKGETGPVREVWTLGDKPRPPPGPYAVTSSPHALTLHFELWHDGGCPISHFVLERHTMQQNWSMGTVVVEV